MIPLDPDLEEMFDVSRTVVREAKMRLIAKGLLQSKAKVGTHVRRASEWNMFDADVLRWHSSMKNAGQFLDELWEIRLIFEPAAARRVAERATNEDCARLARLCDDLAGTTTRVAFAVADLEFHKAILRLSGNRFLQSLGDVIHAGLYMVFAEREGEGIGETEPLVRNHRDLVEAIRSGSADGACQAMENVIRAARGAGLAEA
jgi:DNA-binding FadR family transcriptional regulator